MRLLCWIILACALLIAVPAVAQSDVSTVRLDGNAVFQVGPATDGDDASTRARRIEARLAGLLRNLNALAPPVARQAPSGWSVSVSGIPVVTITDRDAEDNVTTQPALAKRWALALDRSLTRARERRLSWGGRFGAETRASAEAAFGRLTEAVFRIIPRAIAALAVILIFWMFARGVRALLRLIFRRTVDDVTVESLIKQLTYYAILALGFFVAVDALGFDPTTVAAGLGLTGIVLGFALKDILSNFVSGLLLLTLRPFKIGDQIVIGELEGSVERIELRATRLRAYDGRVMLVPNAEVFTSRIVNNTADPVRRGSVGVWLGYDTDLRKAVTAIETATRAAKGVLETPPPVVRLDELGADDLFIKVTFWTDSRRGDFKNTGSAVRAAVLEAFKSADVALPNPDTRIVTLRSER
ncbi:mechanosensitive ion channel family protein [Sphingomonas oligophenolica]|uniref:Small-conductance mechanosensitive channel n=1 Tax=Sphingomonas oligophenolica TaxID=301154 RepID=A0A502BZ91_9SPHN|nr:mechanosensitive ion channel family protein [Sphingomonas oligophenolica]TPG06555.1 mechanosensitive ion channel family protein [Sphingomonas oligophenolica]